MWEKAKEGDEAAWAALIKQWDGRVRSLVWRYVDRDDVDDVCQEVWVQVFKSIKNFRGDSEFMTWLHSIALKTANTWWTRSTKAINKVSLDEMVVDEPYSSDKNTTIDDYVRALTDEDKLIFKLYYEHGYSQNEIAALVGLNTGKAVNSRLVRGRAKIKAELDETIGNP